MTRIVLDGLPLAVRSAGVATYTRELTRAMAEGAPGWSFTLLQPAWPRGSEAGEPLAGNVDRIRSWRYPLVMGLPAPWTPRLLSLESAVGPADIFHGTTYAMPSRHRAPIVTTVHDLALLRHPELGSRGLVRMVERAAREFHRAAHLIAVSETTKRDLVELCEIAPVRVSTVYNGCSADFRPRDRQRCRAHVEKVLGALGPFLLHVGTLEPRKNLPNLIRAFAVLRRTVGIPHKLVLAGDTGWGSQSLPLIAAQAGVADHVLLAGAVDRDLLPILYGAAEVFVYPSRYEGFGLPIVEAMASCTPVVTSNCSALPEIAGDCAILVDPHNIDDIAEGMRRCLDDRAMAETMTQRGLARAAEFTWQNAANKTLAVYRSVLAHPVTPPNQRPHTTTSASERTPKSSF